MLCKEHKNQNATEAKLWSGETMKFNDKYFLLLLFFTMLPLIFISLVYWVTLLR